MSPAVLALVVFLALAGFTSTCLLILLIVATFLRERRDEQTHAKRRPV